MVLSRRHLNKKVVAGVLLATGILVLTGGVYATLWLIPPPIPETPEQALEIIGTSRFERMPEYRKTEYLGQAKRLLDGLSQEQRRDLFQQVRVDETVRQALGRVRQHGVVQRALAFANATAEDRVQMLDAQIDRMEERRAMWRANRPDAAGRHGRSEGGRHGWAGRFREGIQARFEHGNPQINALVGEYFRAMRQRRQERQDR